MSYPPPPPTTGEIRDTRAETSALKFPSSQMAKPGDSGIPTPFLSGWVFYCLERKSSVEATVKVMKADAYGTSREEFWSLERMY